MPAVVNGVGSSVRRGMGHSCGLLLLDLPLPLVIAGYSVVISVLDLICNISDVLCTDLLIDHL